MSQARLLRFDASMVARVLKRNLGVTTGLILAFGLAIWANAVVWTLGMPLLMDPLPYPDEERLFRLWQAKRLSPEDRSNVSPGNILLWQARSRVLEHVGGYFVSPVPYPLESAAPGVFDAVRDVLVTPGFFEALRVSPQLGRLFTEDEAGLRTLPPLVLSHHYWLRRFGGDPAVVGSLIHSAEIGSSRVIGVMPRGFDFPVGADVWRPYYVPQVWLRDQNSRSLMAVARAKKDVSADMIGRELSALRDQIAIEFPKTDTDWTPRGTSVRDELVGPVRPALMAFYCVTALLGGLAFVNVLTLLLVRVQARSGQYAIQVALGAVPSGLRRQLVIEGIAIALAGWAIASVASVATLPVVRPWLPDSLPGMRDFGLDLRVLAGLGVMSVIAGIGWGVLTAHQLERRCLMGALTSRDRADTPGGRESRLSRHLAVVCEVALAVMIVMAAAIAGREALRLHKADPGFDAGHVVVADIGVTVPRWNELFESLPARLPAGTPIHGHATSHALFADDLEKAAREMPGVQRVALSGSVPIGDTHMTALVGRLDAAGGPEMGRGAGVVSANLIQATIGYFETLRIPLHSGRAFSPADHAGTEPAAIVSTALARRIWGRQAVVGELLSQGGEARPLRVVGVAADSVVSRLGEPAASVLYRPYVQSPPRAQRLLLKTARQPKELHASIHDTARRLGANLMSVTTLEDIVTRSTVQVRSAAWALGLLAVVALFLALAGIYATVAAAIQLRRREFCIRLAVGATPAGLSQTVLNQVLGLASIGAMAGCAITLAIIRALNQWIVVPDLTPLTLALAVALGVLTALVAVSLPLIRTRGLEPASLLR